MDAKMTEAYHFIKKGKRQTTEVYPEVGFENPAFNNHHKPLCSQKRKHLR